MVVIDLFSGAGGLTEGFFKEGYEVIAHVEKEKWACETLKTRIFYYYLKGKNDLELYRQYLEYSSDYKKLDEARRIVYNKYPELEEKINIEVLNKTFGNPESEAGTTSTADIIKLIKKSMSYNNRDEVDIIIGGPPCQAYSVIGRARMGDNVKKDKRNFLFYYYRELVDCFKPKAFVFENVPGILTAKNGQIFPIIQKEFDKIGYTLLSGPDPKHKMNILDAKDFGVYQSRKRMILFGFKKKLKFHYPDFMANVNRLDENQTLHNALGDLPELHVGEGQDLGLTGYSSQDAENLSKYQMLMRDNSFGVLNHRARMHRDMDLEIYRKAIEATQINKKLKYFELPKYLKTHHNEKDFQDRFKVHGWEDLPHTIVAHIAKDGHYNIHPDIDQCRSLTVREAARIQSFPDNYKFEGPRTWQYVQVGNAVPPIMAQVIAKSVLEILKNVK